MLFFEHILQIVYTDCFAALAKTEKMQQHAAKDYGTGATSAELPI